ncbi:unnamed protein product [Symbiodinium natans]|uniref:Uncharacterized protein n=1 Tax=Symbiodinium natans TaxID=878477 RepID=A0A812LZ97_9DINO|nr:unnamed protein product [Symbiodinium natans]
MSRLLDEAFASALQKALASAAAVEEDCSCLHENDRPLSLLSMGRGIALASSMCHGPRQVVPFSQRIFQSSETVREAPEMAGFWDAAVMDWLVKALGAERCHEFQGCQMADPPPLT